MSWVGVDALFVEHADASLAGVWTFLVTAPASLLSWYCRACRRGPW
jgi:hypothetical protein